MKRTILAALLPALALMLLVPGSARAAESMRVAYLRTFAMMPFFYAQEKGYFKDEGLNVTGITLNNGPAAAAAVVSGSADVAESANVPVILAVAHHQPIKFFFSENYEQYPKPVFVYLVATGRSGITTLKGLKGKTVAINAATSDCALILRDHLRTAGLGPTAVKLIIIPFPQIPAALQLGEADAACLVEPFMTSVMHAPGKATVLASGSLANLKELGRAPLDGFYAREDWLKKHEKTAASFMRALIKAQRELIANPPVYRQLLVEKFKMPKKLAEEMPVDLNPGNFVVVPGDYQAVIDGLVRTGLLEKPMKASEVIYPIKP
jgi:ABC-type nitrate/sulfonate/bicarbonate transport system substrate-binding protein